MSVRARPLVPLALLWLTFGCWLISSADTASAQDTVLNIDRLLWTDRVGNQHRLQSTNVEFWEEDSISDDFLITGPTGNGVNSGYIQMTTNTDDGLLDSTLELYIKVDAKIDGVGKVGSNWGASNVYQDRKPTGSPAYWPVTIGTTSTVSAVVDNTSTGNEGTAIGFLQAVLFANQYFGTLGAVRPEIDIRFAAAHGNGSSAGGSTMTVGYDAWGSWDTIFHEYGHIIADNNNLDGPVNLPNEHAYGVDNISSRIVMGNETRNYGANNGTLLAWQEGIATYLGLSAVKDGDINTFVKGGNAADPGLPGKDRDEYYDRYRSTNSTTTEANLDFSVGIETADDGSGNVGEGDEASVMRILWDLYDADDTNTEIYTIDNDYSDKWSLGAQNVFNEMKNNTSLWQLWKDIEASQVTTDKRRAELGELFEEYGVSADIAAGLGLADDATTFDATPLLSWDVQNWSHSTRYAVAIFDQNFNYLFDSGDLGNVTSWTIPNIDALAQGSYNWVVISNSILQANLHFEESYWSGAAQFTVVPETSTLLLVASGAAALLMHRRTRRKVQVCTVP